MRAAGQASHKTVTRSALTATSRVRGCNPNSSFLAAQVRSIVCVAPDRDDLYLLVLYLCGELLTRIFREDMTVFEDFPPRGSSGWYDLKQVITIRFSWMLDIRKLVKAEPVMTKGPSGSCIRTRSGDG